MRFLTRTAIALCLSTTSLMSVSGFDGVPQQDESPVTALEAARIKAEENLKHTFSKFEFYSIKASVIDGLFEIDTGSQMIYYAPDANVILFGEMWDNQGNNLTQAALSTAATERMKDFDLSHALEFGPEGAPLITEYSNPHCGYCQEFHAYLESKGRNENVKVRRRIIFTVGHSEKAQQAAEHILCSDDPEQAFSDIYERKHRGPLIKCAEGRERLLQHIEIARTAGVQGTPTLVVGGELVRGFHKARIEEFLQQASTEGE